MRKLMKFGLLLLLIISSCKSENEKFNDVIKSKNMELAQKFKQQYPQSKYLLRIDSLIIATEYHNLLKTDNDSDYEKFINKYISGNYVDSAWAKIYKNDWDGIKNTNNSLYYEYYIGKYPKSPYYSLAENWLFENANSGHFIDKRDSKHYSWTKVNNQIWMSTQLQFNKPYRYAVYSKNELENICPDGWRLPNVSEWKDVIEYYTKQVFSGSTIISNKETFFTNACVSFKNQYGFKQKEWDFLALSTTNNKQLVFHVSYTGDVDYHIYYVTERHLFDNCYVLCIKNTNIKESQLENDNYIQDMCKNNYKTVKIGNKVWMNQNLSTTKFSNGDIIPTTIEQSYNKENNPQYQWSNPNYDEKIYGRYYTWYVIHDNRNVCPSGWHVATENEWNDVINGNNKNQSDSNKEKFVIQKIGYKGYDNFYPDVSGYGYYWTSSNKAIMFFETNYSFDSKISKNMGLPIRCVKD